MKSFRSTLSKIYGFDYPIHLFFFPDSPTPVPDTNTVIIKISIKFRHISIDCNVRIGKSIQLYQLLYYLYSKYELPNNLSSYNIHYSLNNFDRQEMTEVENTIAMYGIFNDNEACISINISSQNVSNTEAINNEQPSANIARIQIVPRKIKTPSTGNYSYIV